jgi:hypothetical protein
MKPNLVLGKPYFFPWELHIKLHDINFVLEKNDFVEGKTQLGIGKLELKD